jgi:hypothetical protein
MSWLAWNPATPCPVCGGHLYGGHSGEDGKLCTGGFNDDRPTRAFCSTTRSDRRSASGKTFEHLVPTIEWRNHEGSLRGSGSRYWPTGVPSDFVLTRTYSYTSQRGGSPFYCVLRYEAPEDQRAALRDAGRRAKEFRPATPHPDGGWRWGLGEVTRIPYMLPDWREARNAGGHRMFLVEGEKDVERGYQHLLEHPQPAAFTCAAGGVRGLDAFLRDHKGYVHFRGIDVLDVILDRDEAGSSMRDVVDQHLVKTGDVDEARYWLAAVDARGADLADHLDASFELDDLVPAL